MSKFYDEYLGTEALKDRYLYLMQKARDGLIKYFDSYFEKNKFFVYAEYNVEMLADLCVRTLREKFLYEIGLVGCSSVCTSLNNAEYLLLIESLKGTIDVSVTGIDDTSFIIGLNYVNKPSIAELSALSELADFMQDKCK